jgi:hypothetical protein
MKTIYDLFVKEMSGKLIGKEVLYENKEYRIKKISPDGYLILEDYFRSVEVPFSEMNKLEIISSPVPKHGACKGIVRKTIIPSDKEAQKVLDAQEKFLKECQKITFTP